MEHILANKTNFRFLLNCQYSTGQIKLFKQLLEDTKDIGPTAELWIQYITMVFMMESYNICMFTLKLLNLG
jgi:hypothetical protein